jgi:hypothetical protein
MEKHQLSKSTFIRGVQCLKSLYLYKNRYYLRDRLSAEQLAKFKRGIDVGIFAQDLFPGGVDCKPKSPSQYRKSVEKTADLVFNNKTDVIYEAAFQSDGVLILLDILVRNGNNWDAFEIKSSLKVSETFMLDAALQYYVLVNSGVNIHNFYLVHLNPGYVRGDVLQINDLFKFVDVTESVQQKTNVIEKQIAAEKDAIALKSSPKIDIGTHCRNPYPCDFIGHCWKHIPKKSVFDLVSWTEEARFEFYRKGILRIEDIPESMAVTANQNTELHTHQSGNAYCDKQHFDQFMKAVDKNFCFISFMGYKQAIPLWPGYAPYDSVPVTFGICNNQLSQQQIFLNQSKAQPDSLLISFLEDHLSEFETLLIYEGEELRNLLSQMIFRNPNKSDLLGEISEKIVELRDVFTEFIYYSPKSGNDLSLASIGHNILRESNAMKITKDLEIGAINSFLSQPDLSEEAMILQRAYIESHLNITAKLHQFLLKVFAG